MFEILYNHLTKCTVSKNLIQLYGPSSSSGPSEPENFGDLLWMLSLKMGLFNISSITTSEVINWTVASIATTANVTVNKNKTGDVLLLTPQDHYKIGIVLAVFGNFIIAVSLNIQKFAHRKQEAAAAKDYDVTSPRNYLRSGCIAVIANGGLAVIFNAEALRMQDILGGTFAIVGGFLIIEFSQQSDHILNAQQILEHLGCWQFIIYVFVEVMIYGIIIFLRCHKDKPKHGVIIHLILVAILGSFTVISAKAVSGMLALTIEGSSQLVYPVFYLMLAIMVVTTILQVKYLNEAMAKFDVAVVVPINFVLFTISAIFAGAIFYQEFFNRRGILILMFFFGCWLSFSGVIFITTDKSKPNNHEGVALHLDMMPNFIRSLAPSLQTMNVQPKRNQRQVISFPEEVESLLGNQTRNVNDPCQCHSDSPGIGFSERSQNLGGEENRMYSYESESDTTSDWDENWPDSQKVPIHSADKDTSQKDEAPHLGTEH
ncbi:NIPA-like protein 2 isoform X2 [Clavelina lepadiformis]|uniref:NIPA-like protein 2 isoform X2 n=1 Tax=Clavelina lepadiformis TaxID=159417 RepID=UPI004041701E